jgi:two-component system, chemotaxis family, response regulator Rcp1
MKAATEVLFVDDNPGDTDLAAEVLSRNDCPSNVHSVVDGVEAMDFLRRKGKHADAPCPHLIVLDLNMPRKGGLAVLAEAKLDPDLRRIPIVIFSASLARGDIARSYELGANNYVGKPGDLNGFVAAVTAIGDFWFGVASVVGREDR